MSPKTPRELIRPGFRPAEFYAGSLAMVVLLHALVAALVVVLHALVAALVVVLHALVAAFGLLAFTVAMHAPVAAVG